MSREIKFKIFANEKWYYKCLVGNTNNTSDDNWTCPLVWSDEKKDWVHCDNGVICQYTGLKDKNGVEIYEGDILKDQYEQFYKVLWDDFKISFQMEQFYTKSRYSIFPTDLLNMEIIGNIYENPELLEVSDE